MPRSKKLWPAILFPAIAIVVGLAAIANVQAFQPGKPPAKNTSAQRVRESVQQGVDFLLDQQRGDGIWSEHGHPGDVTALVTLALLNAGEAVDSDAMQAALQYIADRMPQDRLSTYSASLKIMALEMADPKGKKYLREVEDTVQWLLDNQIARDGGWGYGAHRNGRSDSSNTQFAILALHAAVKMGVPIPPKVWKNAEEYWVNCFQPGGGFSYALSGVGNVGNTLSMACAGIASWIIIQENLSDFDRLVDGNRARACGSKDEMTPVEQTIEYLAKRFGVRGARHTNFYYLYALERAGRLSGQRFFGVHDWYRSGSLSLVEGQNKLTGCWKGSGHAEDNANIATAMGLLFLAKGKRPVAIGHYQYGQGDHWNNHPKGVHYLTRAIETQWETKLNWQTVKSQEASVDDLLESPVLFFSGVDSFELGPQQKENLRKYIDNGGFIFAEACDGEGCGNASGFDRSFRALMAELFPETQLQAVPPDHPLWSSHFSILPNEERPLLGLQACCRTSVIYCRGNLSSYWNLNRPGLRQYVNQKQKQSLEQRVDYCTQLGVNVVSYATGRLLRERGDTPTVDQQRAKSVLVNRTLTIGKLRHGGGSDEAPNALKNIMLQLEAEGIEADTDKTMVEPVMSQLASYPVLFIHGRSSFEFKESQRAAIRAWLESGGFLFADSICSNESFTKSFRQEMKRITGTGLAPIPQWHEIWTNDFGGFDIPSVTLRKRDATAAGGFRASRTPPRFEGIELDGRLAIVFSPYDLSCALENLSVSQCDGLTRPDAERIGLNIILYAQQVD